MRDHGGLLQGRSRTEQCAGYILKTATVDWSWVMMERNGLEPRESRIESEHGVGTLLSSFPGPCGPYSPSVPLSPFQIPRTRSGLGSSVQPRSACCSWRVPTVMCVCREGPWTLQYSQLQSVPDSWCMEGRRVGRGNDLACWLGGGEGPSV